MVNYTDLTRCEKLEAMLYNIYKMYFPTGYERDVDGELMCPFCYMSTWDEDDFPPHKEECDWLKIVELFTI